MSSLRLYILVIIPVISSPRRIYLKLVVKGGSFWPRLECLSLWHDFLNLSDFSCNAIIGILSAFYSFTWSLLVSRFFELVEYSSLWLRWSDGQTWSCVILLLLFFGGLSSPPSFFRLARPLKQTIGPLVAGIQHMPLWQLMAVYCWYVSALIPIVRTARKVRLVPNSVRSAFSPLTSSMAFSASATWFTDLARFCPA